MTVTLIWPPFVVWLDGADVNGDITWYDSDDDHDVGDDHDHDVGDNGDATVIMIMMILVVLIMVMMMMRTMQN